MDRNDRLSLTEAFATIEELRAALKACVEALLDADDCCSHYHDTSYTAWSPQGVQLTRDHIETALAAAKAVGVEP